MAAVVVYDVECIVTVDKHVLVNASQSSSTTLISQRVALWCFWYNNYINCC